LFFYFLFIYLFIRFYLIHNENMLRNFQSIVGYQMNKIDHPYRNNDCTMVHAVVVVVLVQYAMVG